MSSRVPVFLVPREPLHAGWRAALAALGSHEYAKQSSQFVRLFRAVVEAKDQQRNRAVVSSALLHFAVAFFLVHVPLGQPDLVRSSAIHRERRAPLFYELRLVKLPKTLPSVAPPGPGGRPGVGLRRDRLPPPGSTALHPRLTIVLNPPRPDNYRQTILQPASPPDLRIGQNLPLANLITGNLIRVPRPQLDYHPNVASATVPMKGSQAAPTPPSIAVAPPELIVAQVLPINPQPHLPVPPPPAVLSARVPQRGIPGAAAGMGDGDADPAIGAGLLVVGVDPADWEKLFSLPPGNRDGAFSISPAGGRPGSPGGVPGGDPNGGAGGRGNGGDASSGVGSGKGGGGGGSADSAVLSIHGGNGPGVGAGKLRDSSPAALIFPVVSPPHVRRNALIVSTGPMGGGGLNAYGALHCGKIYTVFVPMPGKNWVLQYCARANSAQKSAPRVAGTVVQLDPGLVPPDAEERFDFPRLPIPEDKADKAIVLHGMIREDGTVGELKVFQGLLPELDEAAVAALSRWRFRPALRANQPVTVEILVGIPARVPKL